MRRGEGRPVATRVTKLDASGKVTWIWTSKPGYRAKSGGVVTEGESKGEFLLKGGHSRPGNALGAISKGWWANLSTRGRLLSQEVRFLVNY
ncbi:MAG: hypothetical protein GY811_07225 [Myxococcales bacterium]|nr:hypothetical protein [Myxococcales bacterium]